MHWTLPPGYYAYKTRMSLESGTPGALLGVVRYPQGEIHKDEYFGAQEIFRGDFVVQRARHARRRCRSYRTAQA